MTTIKDLWETKAIPSKEINRRLKRLFPLHTAKECFKRLSPKLNYSWEVLKGSCHYRKWYYAPYRALIMYISERERKIGYADALEVEDE